MNTTLKGMALMLGLLGVANADAQPVQIEESDTNIQPRIVGGGDIRIEQTPSIAALLDKSSISLGANYREAQFCGGSLISSDWVVTAAHCVYDVDGELRDSVDLGVLLGSGDLSRPDTDPVNVVEIIPHPLYISTLVLEGAQDELIEAAWRPESDIALLRLEVESDISSILIDGTPGGTDELGYVSGWGALNEGSAEPQQFPNNLQGAIVNMYSSELCSDRFPELSPFLGRGLLCASREATDTCQGDSGGPIYSLSIRSGRLYNLAGLTSWGIGCGNDTSPGVYTDIAQYVEWIQSHVDDVVVSYVDSSLREDDLMPVLDGLYPHIEEDAPLSSLSALGTGSLGYLSFAVIGVFYAFRRRPAYLHVIGG